MVNIAKYTTEKKDEWNAFNSASKNGLFMFDRNYMDYHSDRFVDHSLMFYDEKDRLVAIMPCSEHEDGLRSHGGLTYGGIVSNIKMRQTVMNQCFESLEQYCCNNNINRIYYKTVPHFYHLQPAEEDIFSLYYYGFSFEKFEASTVVNLKSPIKYSKGRKTNISKAVREGIEVVLDNSIEAYDRFMKIEDDILIEHHNVHAVHTGAEMHMLYERFPENIHLYTALSNGNIIGGAIIYIYPNVVHTQYMCANDEARDKGALDATINRIIQDFSNDKQWLDFGISTENNGRFLNEGLISQKEGFGGRTVVYNTWGISYDNIEKE